MELILIIFGLGIVLIAGVGICRCNYALGQAQKNYKH